MSGVDRPSGRAHTDGRMGHHGVTAAYDDDRPDWGQALCKGYDPDMFFSTRDIDKAAARAVCSRCPIQQECQAWAFKTRQMGMWGGRWFGDVTFRADKMAAREATMAAILAQYNRAVMETPCPTCKVQSGRCRPARGGVTGYRPVAPHKARLDAMAVRASAARLV